MGSVPPEQSGEFDSLSLEVESTVDRAAAELRRAIFEGELESGTALRELALATSLGVSRSTVREALTLLVAEGLAVREPNRGVSIASPDPDSVHDLCLSRAVLETGGVRRWADASEEDRESVRTRLDEYRAAVENGADYQELNERHLALHLSFVALTGSPRLVAMAESLYAELKLALAQVERIRRNQHDQLDAHALLVEQLEQGDVEATVAALEEHLAHAEVTIRESLAL